MESDIASEKAGKDILEVVERRSTEETIQKDTSFFYLFIFRKESTGHLVSHDDSGEILPHVGELDDNNTHFPTSVIVEMNTGIYRSNEM